MYALRDMEAADALTLMEAELGPSKRYGNKYMWCCPFHQDKTPSFVLFPDTSLHCFGCGKHFKDIKTYFQVVHQIGLDYEPKLAPTSSKKKEVVLTEADARDPHIFGRLKALPYFQKRAISEPVFEETLLGYSARWNQQHENHWVKAGSEWLEIPTRFYTIPYIVNGQVLGIQRRRDDEHVAEYMEEMPQVVERVQKHYPDEEITNKLFGPRYNWQSPFSALPYGVDLFVDYQPDGTRAYRHYEFALVTEGEINQLALRTAGFPALKAKKASDQTIVKGVPSLLRNVTHLFVVADNDGGPGLELALAIQKIIGRGYIIVPPKGFKDVDDLAVAGELYSWLKTHCLEPILSENAGQQNRFSLMKGISHEQLRIRGDDSEYVRQ